MARPTWPSAGGPLAAACVVFEERASAPTTEVRDARTMSLTILAVLASIAALKFAEVILIPIVLGVLISYALDPLVTVLARARVPRSLGATLLVTMLFAGLFVGGYALRDDATAFVQQLPDAAHRIGQLLQSRGKANTVGKVQQAAGELEQAASAATRPSAPPPGGVPRVQVEQPPLNIRDYLLVGSASLLALAAQLIIVVFLALYLLASGNLFKRKLVRIVGPSLTQKKITVEILDEIDRQIATFLLVRALISLIVGVATWLGLELVGLNNAALWGVAAGVLNIIPYIGPSVIAALAALAGFLQFGNVWMAVASSGATVVVAMLEGYVLTPWLTSRAAQMNAVSVFVGLLFFGWLWGVWGMLLAVPLLMVLKAVCDRIEDLRPVAELLGE